MDTGTAVSGIGHLGLIAWVLVGGIFSAPSEPAQVADVSVLSGAEFAALRPPKEGGPAEEKAPERPEAPDKAGPASRPSPGTAPPAEDAAEPAAPTTPETAPETAPAPPAKAEQQAETEEAAPRREAETAPVTRPGDDAAPAPAPRVAPRPAAPQEPDTETAETVREATRAEETGERPEPERAATAPEAATSEIAPDAADSPSPTALAPPAAPRPPARPARRTARTTEPAPQPEPETPATQEKPAPPGDEREEMENAIDSALAELEQDGAAGTGAAQTPGGGGTAASGPPLTAGERDALRVAVQDCWVVDVGSEAADVTVTVGMRMNPDGTVARDSLRMVAAKGGEGRAAKVAFEAARRAVLRCERGGYDLPAAKYDRWREIELTFNPEEMRLR